MRNLRLACFLLPAVVQVAAAGVLWVEAGTDYVHHVPIGRTVKVDPSRVSIEIQNAKSHQTLVYQRAPEHVWMIDHIEKFYREFDGATLEILRGQVEAVSGAAADQNEGGPDSELRFAEVWSGESVGGRTCDRYEGRIAGMKVWDVCAGDWAQFELDANTLDPLREAMQALRTLRLWPEDELMLPRRDGKDETQFRGWPVQRIRQHDDRPVEFLELRELEMRDFAHSDFLPPSDYTKRQVVLVPAQSAEGQQVPTQPKETP